MNFNCNLRPGKKVFEIILLIVILFSGCSSKINRNDKLNLELKTGKINAWINLMPGSRHLFHVAADCILINKSGYKVKNIQFQKAVIIQNKKSIYEFVPAIKTEGKILELNPADSLKFNFRNKIGIPLSGKLDYDSNINILLSLFSNGKNAECFIRNIKIQKVY